MLDNHQTVQTVKSPTRYGETTATLIDHVITPITLECESFVVNAAISDHLPVVTYIYPSTPSQTYNTSPKRKNTKSEEALNLEETIKSLDCHKYRRTLNSINIPP